MGNDSLPISYHEKRYTFMKLVFCSLIVRSRMKDAELFATWESSEVLPSKRNGSYTVNYDTKDLCYLMIHLN